MGFLLLLRKNLLISRRTPIWTIFEVIMPLAVAIFAVAIFEEPDLSYTKAKISCQYSRGISRLHLSVVYDGDRQSELEQLFTSMCGAQWNASTSNDEPSRNNDFTRDEIPSVCDSQVNKTSCNGWWHFKSMEEILKQRSGFNYAIKINDFNLNEGRLDYDFVPLAIEEKILSQTLTEYGAPTFLGENILMSSQDHINVGLLLEMESRVMNRDVYFNESLPTLSACASLGRGIEWKDFFPKLFPILIYLIMLPVFLNTANNLAAEIESGVWEFLLVMGERPYILWLSHYVYAVMKMLPTIFVFSIGIQIAMKTPLLSVIAAWSIILLTLYFVALGMSIGCFMQQPAGAIKVSIFLWVGLMFPGIMLTNIYEPGIGTYLAELTPYASIRHAIVLFHTYKMRDAAWDYNMPDVVYPPNVLGASIVCLVYAHLALLVMANFKSLSKLSIKGIFRKFVKPKTDFDHPVHNSWHEPAGDSARKPVADVECKGVVKVWENTGEMAVRGLDLKAYCGEVTVLLGHNGAGKSTTYSMISGITRPTAGTITITGHDIVKETNACRAAMGFCMQSNCLFPKLTTRDHLWFYHMLKNGEGSWNVAADRLSQELDMMSYQGRRAVDLSGGQKRKLSVALALIGDSKVILLDEPTAGMDPASRRAMEKIIHVEKQNRTIMLTTHYMDEAEAMGDRILIMHAGHVVASGTSMYLKKRFGCAYVLSVVIGSGKVEQNVTKTVQDIVAIGNTTHKAKQIDYEINVTEQKKLPDLLEKLESSKTELGIASFGLSLNTLEDVFVKVGQIAEKEAGHELVEEEDNTEYKLAGGFLHEMYMHLVLYAKKMFYTASVSNLVFQVLIPILLAYFVIIGHHNTGGAPTYEMTMPRYKGLVFNLFGSNKTNGEFARNYAEKHGLTVKEQSTPTNGTNFEQNYPWTMGGYCAEQNLYFYVDYAPLAGMAVGRMMLENLYGQEHKISVRAAYYDKFGAMNALRDFLVMVTLLLVLPLITSQQVGQSIVERTTKFKHQQFMAGVGVLRYWLTIFVADFAAYALVCIAILVMDGISIKAVPEWKIWFFLLMYAPPTLFFSYLISFAIDSPTKAAVLMLIVQFVGGSLILIGGLSIESMLKHSRPFSWHVHFALPISASIVGFFGRRSPGTWTESSEKYAMIFLIVETLVFAALLLLKEFQLFGKIFNKMKEWNEELVNEEDVLNEQAYIDTNPMGLALKVYKLTKYYKKFCALKGTSYGMQRGEVFGLLGESGAGKTTTFQILTAESLPSSGSAVINDRPISRSSRIGYVPQFDAVMPSFSCRQNMFVLGGIIGYEELCRRISSMLKLVRLADHANKNASSLSGGQRRRLSIGVALMTTSDLIIMDEPTAGVDPMARRDIWKAMEIAKKAGKGIMLSSHSMEECEALCDRVAVLCQGRLVAINSCQQLKSKHSLVFVLVVLIESKSKFDMVVGTIQAAFPDAVRQNTEFVSFTIKWHVPRTPGSMWSKMFREIQKIAEDLHLKEYCLSQSTLEDTFLALNRKYYVPVPGSKPGKEDATPPAPDATTPALDAPPAPATASKETSAEGTVTKKRSAETGGAATMKSTHKSPKSAATAKSTQTAPASAAKTPNQSADGE